VTIEEPGFLQKSYVVCRPVAKHISHVWYLPGYSKSRSRKVILYNTFLLSQHYKFVYKQLSGSVTLGTDPGSGVRSAELWIWILLHDILQWL
jgi:hypothetical protein